MSPGCSFTCVTSIANVEITDTVEVMRGFFRIRSLSHLALQGHNPHIMCWHEMRLKSLITYATAAATDLLKELHFVSNTASSRENTERTGFFSDEPNRQMKILNTKDQAGQKSGQQALRLPAALLRRTIHVWVSGFLKKQNIDRYVMQAAFIFPVGIGHFEQM